MIRHVAIASLKDVEGEREAARLALAHTLQVVSRDPGAIGAGTVGAAELRRAADNVDATYAIRLFARFEAVLRNYWASIRNTEPPMRDLLTAIGAKTHMPIDDRDDVDEVREFRNSLVHEDEMRPRLSFAECRSRLCRFLSWLPPYW